MWVLFCEFQPFHLYFYIYRNVSKQPLFTFSFLKTILGKKTHNTPICVYGVFERLGIDLTEYTDTRAGKKEKHIILVMEDYSSRWVVFLAKDASSGKITLNRYLLPLFLLPYRFSWARIIINATAEEIALLLYDVCLGLALVPNTIQTDNGKQFVSHVVRLEIVFTI